MLPQHPKRHPSHHPEPTISYARTHTHTKKGWPVPDGSFAVTDNAGTWLAPHGGGGGGAVRALFDFTCVPVAGEPEAGGPNAEGGPESRRYQVGEPS